MIYLGNIFLHGGTITSDFYLVSVLIDAIS